MKKSVFCSLTIATFLALVSCRSSDFLYYQENRPPSIVSLNQKIKEIHGDSDVDILWVIDNSGSMGEHQLNVQLNTDLFIKQFTKSNLLRWKMGLISTDSNNTPFLGMGSAQLLDWTTPDPIKIFVNSVGRLGVMGSPQEQMFIPVRKNLTTYPGFLRSNAILALIIVTDAPEQSKPTLFAKDFLAFLEKEKGSINRVITYGVLGAQDMGCPATDDRWDYQGSPYEEVIQATHGKLYKLCTKNFGQNLADLGQDLVNRVLNSKVDLKFRPKVSSIQVLHNGIKLPSGPKDQGGYWFFDFDLNAVVFHDLAFAQGDDESVLIEYEPDDGF